MSNLIAWSYVLAGYALVDQGKFAEALEQFKMVAFWPKKESYADAQGLAYNEMLRVFYGLNDGDVSRRKQWLEHAKIMNRMDDEERQLANQLIAQAGYQAHKRIDQIQNDQADLSYWYGATPAHPGGYDPTQNPNYHGNDDAPPGVMPE